jgi:hypothetical protein
MFEREPDYRPTVERPLVFKLFGDLGVPDSQVWTTDDREGLIQAVNRNDSIMPAPIRRALADSTLLFVGCTDADLRMLTNSILGEEDNRRLRRYAHIAVVDDFSAEVTARRMRITERFSGRTRKQSTDVYWATIHEFANDLAAAADVNANP